MPSSYRQWVYAKPMLDGVLGPDQFELREQRLPKLEAGEALIRVNLINIHSATRARMATGMTKLGETDRSNYACAEIIRSRDPSFAEGDVIACQAGWQDYQVISSRESSVGYDAPSEAVTALNLTNSQWCYVFRPAMVTEWRSDVLMDVFGTSGMTAYFGMRECGPLATGDQVAVAGATGSVGSLVAQLARIAGCRVIGFAGGEERCRWVVNEFGVDDCLNYRADEFPDQLCAAFPNGIDVFSDGIGGLLTPMVARRMNRGGRIFAFGCAGSFYGNDINVPQQRLTLRQAFGISDEVEIIMASRGLRAEAWIVDAFYHERLAAEDALAALMRSGKLKPVSNVVEGFEKLPEAIIELYRKPHAGKLQIRLGA
jgi:NADPH-dependent curcumin reductase CurA